MSKWKTIMNNLTDGTETAIVGWEENDEDGKTIAIIIHKTKEIEYRDNNARTDSYAQEMIKEVLDEICQ